MFQMINEKSTQPSDGKMVIVRAAALTIALLVLCGVVYFFAFLPYANH